MDHHGCNSDVVSGAGGFGGGVNHEGRIVFRGGINAGKETLFKHCLGIFVWVDLLDVSDIVGFFVAWGTASIIVDGGDADDQVVKLFLEEDIAVLMVLVPLVGPLFEIFALGSLGEVIELIFYIVHEEGVIGVEYDPGELVLIFEKV